ncbi:MAG: hypothetical protein K0U47_00780 [Epsilonproteobacteria bacterium]|nr:hypothetical protein [Campylobacterota bacterium]
MKKIFILLMMTLSLYAYELGRGISLVDGSSVTLKMGGHLSVDFESLTEDEDRTNSLNVENIGLLLYGNASHVSYLAEIGNDDSYRYDFDDAKIESQDLELKRLYLSYDLTNALTLKGGRFLTPIGIWNPTYINALRWTTVRPFVAQEFFPDIITGLQVHGRFGKDESYEYSLFKQLKTETKRSVSKIPTSNFFGGELRYHFGINDRVAIVGGHYDSLEKQEDAWLGGLNTQIALGDDEFSAELLYKDASWQEKRWEDLSWYLQYVHAFAPLHYGVARIGQKERFNNWDFKEGLVGYVYRPTPALSFKTEFRRIEKHGHNAYDDNQLFFSFSVLF